MEEMIKRDAHKFDEACVQFAKTFPKIIREIRAVNPDVKIYADNIYNPAKGIDAFSQVYSVADAYINRMNRGFYPSDEYVLVDLKKCFDGEKESMVNLSFKGREIDPHPSEKCIPESGLIPVDFRQPSDCSWEDDIAASVAACGLIELSKVAKEWKKKNYLDAAVRMLKALDEKSCSYDIKTDYLLERCTAAYGDEKHNFPIVYGDYYYIEAIWKLTGEELFIW